MTPDFFFVPDRGQPLRLTNYGPNIAKRLASSGKSGHIVSVAPGDIDFHHVMPVGRTEVAPEQAAANLRRAKGLQARRQRAATIAGNTIASLIGGGA